MSLKWYLLIYLPNYWNINIISTYQLVIRSLSRRGNIQRAPNLTLKLELLCMSLVQIWKTLGRIFDLRKENPGQKITCICFRNPLEWPIFRFQGGSSHVISRTFRKLCASTIRLVTSCIRRKSCVIQTGKSEFKSSYRAGPTPISIKASKDLNLP